MTSSGCQSRNNSTCDSPVILTNNNNHHHQPKQISMGRPPSSISLITDQLKLSSLNESDSCMTMRMKKMTIGIPITTTTAATSTKSMNTQSNDIHSEHDSSETINKSKHTSSMPTHSIIGLQSKRTLTSTNNNNDHSNNNNNNNNNSTDWRTGSKDYHHSRTVHFHDVFTPNSSVCSSLQSTISEIDDENEITNLEQNSSSLHVLSASAPATNYSFSSMSNVFKFNEIQSCHQHCHHLPHSHHCHHQIHRNTTNTTTTTTTTDTTSNNNNNTITPSTYTFNFSSSSSSFPCSVDDKIDPMNISNNQPSSIPSKIVCSSSASSASFLLPSSGSCYCCATCCSCCLLANNISSYPHIQYLNDRLPPAKRVCRSTSSSSDIHSQTSSSYGYACRQLPFNSIMSSSCSCNSYIPPPPPPPPSSLSSSSSLVASHRYCHKYCSGGISSHSNTNNNQHNSTILMKTMQSYMRTLPRPIAVRLDSKVMYNEKSKSCTNMDNVKLLTPNDNHTNYSTLKNPNHGVILRPKPSDSISFNKINNGSRVSWHHPLFNFGCGTSQTNSLSLQTEANEITMQHDNSPTDISQTQSDSLQNSIHPCNRTTHSNSSGHSTTTTTTTTTTNTNSNQFNRAHPPSHIDIKDPNDSSLSIHALPRSIYVYNSLLSTAIVYNYFLILKYLRYKK
ncbi:unnamed protein product [Schistosoma turkestanicum]|nr:unnamed protein product [Schistosoma turkestanicum]